MVQSAKYRPVASFRITIHPYRICVFIHTTNKSCFLPILWLFIAPLVASITSDDIPNVQRSIVMFPMLEILAGYGVVNLLLYCSKEMEFCGIIDYFVFTLNVVYFYISISFMLHLMKLIYRFNGFKEMVLSVKDVYDQYDHIIVTKTSGGMYPHILFL